MPGELRFDDVKLGDKIAGRYELKSIITADNGEAADFVCDYEGFPFRAKIYYDDSMPKEDVFEKQKSITSPYLPRPIEQDTHNGHFYKIIPNFQGIMSKPVNDKILMEHLIPDVVEALKTIHAEGIIHGHVRPRNIFYKPMSDEITLGDYGVSLEHMRDFNGDIAMNYLPPEVQDDIYDEKADYYSLGVTLVHLITGKNPFEGMNKKKMLKTASTIEFSVPPKVNPTLQTIIKGLTVKDHATRWGSSEVERALAGEEVEVVDNYVYVPPKNEFEFNGVKYEDLGLLVNAFAGDWFNAVEAIRKSKFTDFVEDYDAEVFGVVKQILAVEDDNIALFQLLYAINPDLPFCWKGMSFADLNAFSSEMLAAADKTPYKDIFSDGALLSYLQFKGADDDTISNIARLSDDARNGKDDELLAYKLDYMISGQFTYVLDDVPFTDVDSILSYLQLNVKDVVKLCDAFINDKRFFAWLDVLGYEEQIEQWRAEVG